VSASGSENPRPFRYAPKQWSYDRFSCMNTTMCSIRESPDERRRDA
jgi:hypothetical protein